MVPKSVSLRDASWVRNCIRLAAAPASSLLIVAFLSGCFARNDMPVSYYRVAASYSTLPDCLYRAVQDDSSIILAQPQITRLENPTETRITVVPAGSIMTWEVSLRPLPSGAVRIESREIGNIWGTSPAWKTIIEPKVEGCAGKPSIPDLSGKPPT
jgi:hypothetical protein